MTKKKIFSKNIIKYIEAIIYILAIIVGIFACNSGPIYIKMLPILFILGFVGRIIFDRPVMTTIFGIVTAICIIRVTNNISIKENIFFSLCDGLNIAMGELCGEYFLRSKKFYTKRKKLKNKGVLSTYLMTFVIFIFAILLHIFTNGNYVSYFKARSSLYDYLNEEYKDEKFREMGCKYTFYKTKSYTFTMRNITSNINSNFIVIKNNKYAVFDEYKFKLTSQNNTKIYEELKNYIGSENFNLEYKIGYLENGKLKVILSREVEMINDQAINEFSNDVDKYVEKLKNFSKKKKIYDIEILLIDKSDNSRNLLTNILTENLEKIGNLQSYIIDSFNVEYID